MGVYRKRGCCDPSYGGFRGRLVPRPRKTKLWCRFAHGSTFSIDAIGALKRGDELLLMWDVPEIVSKGLSPEDKAILEVSGKVPMRVRRAVCIHLTRLLRSLLEFEDPPVEGLADDEETVERAPALESERATAPRLKDTTLEDVFGSV
jgi:hypothetical protein